MSMQMMMMILFDILEYFKMFFILIPQVEHIFTSYPKGLRFIKFKHKGKDEQFWAGHYGSKFTMACVRFNLGHRFVIYRLKLKYRIHESVFSAHVFSTNQILKQYIKVTQIKFSLLSILKSNLKIIHAGLFKPVK